MGTFVPSGVRYRWKVEAQHSTADAQVFGERLEFLRHRLEAEAVRTGDEVGELDPLDVITDARHPSSPIHHLFNWDDSDAADRWRLHEAEQALQALTVVRARVGPAPDSTPVRGVAAISPAGPRRPARVEACDLETPAQRAAYIREAIAEARSWARKYADIPELHGVCSTIRATARRLARQLAEAEHGGKVERSA